MQRNVNPVVAVIVIAIFSSLIGAIYWSGLKSSQVDSPGFFQPAQRNSIALSFDGDIIELDQYGAILQTYHLADLGITQPFGDFLVFSNGDLLVYQGQPECSLIDSLMVFLRLQTPESPNQAGRGFLRCDTYRGRCEPFASDLPAMDRIFRLARDHQDNIYISDTANHRLLLLTSSGTLKTRSSGSFRFPNQISVIDDQLWVADTNHHELKEIDRESGALSDVRRTIDAAVESRRYPVNFAVVGDEWWVVILDNHLANGVVQRYDREGQALSRLELPAGADPFSIATLTDRVLLGDRENLRIYSFDFSGNRLEDFEPPPISEMLDRSRAQQRFYNSLKVGFIACFAILLIFGIILGFLLEKRALDAVAGQTREAEIQRPLSVLSTPTGSNEEYWLPKSKSWSQIARWMPWWLGLWLLCPLVFLVAWPEQWVVALMLFIFAVVGGAPMFCVFRVMLNSRIGIAGNLMLLRDHRGNTEIGRGEDVFRSDSFLQIREVIVPIGSKVKPLFDKADFKQWFEPRLRGARELSEIQMLIQMWKLRHPFLLANLSLLVGLVVLLVIVELWIG